MQRSFEWLAILAVVALLAGAAGRLAAALEGGSAWLLLLAALLVSHVVADFVSGCAHWLADRVLSEEIPFLGPRFVRPFREHHEDPLGMLRYDWSETNGNTCISALPLAVAAWYAAAGAQPAEPWSSARAGFWLFLCLWIVLTNQFHKWAHAPRPPRLAVALQRGRLILEPAHHRRHHAAPFDRHFCITAGWLNPLLDRARFFARLERALAGAARRSPTGPSGSPRCSRS